MKTQRQSHWKTWLAGSLLAACANVAVAVDVNTISIGEWRLSTQFCDEWKSNQSMCKLFAEPNVNAKEVTSVRRGSRLNVLEKSSSGWVKVQFGTAPGWEKRIGWVLPSVVGIGEPALFGTVLHGITRKELRLALAESGRAPLLSDSWYDFYEPPEGLGASELRVGFLPDGRFAEATYLFTGRTFASMVPIKQMLIARYGPSYEGSVYDAMKISMWGGRWDKRYLARHYQLSRADMLAVETETLKQGGSDVYLLRYFVPSLVQAFNALTSDSNLAEKPLKRRLQRNAGSL
tara:strand:+ start:21 stop:890 length:870 start_codon:yes stop_codon:yes gene_type:complete